MSNIRMGRGLLRPRGGSNVNRLNTTQTSEGSTIPSLMSSTDNFPPSVNSNNDTNQQRVVPSSGTGVVR